MPILRTLLGLALGRRLPVTSGDLAVPGLRGRATVRRDAYGIPYIDADSDFDAWFALGFCQAQDRAFQLETLLRVGRGTLAALVGPAGLPLDRLARRVGFLRSATTQLAVLSAEATATLDAFCDGIEAGYAHGLPRKPHELALLGGPLTPWTPADVLASLKVISFLLPSNWDAELARLRALTTDGPDALHALDPAMPPTAAIDPRVAAVAAALAADLAAFQAVVPTGGGSNNFVVGGSRTLSGLPLLGSDPHLSPTVPGPWYLAHVRTPTWSVAGATFAGTPTFAIGHNDEACWGVTAGLTDNTDLWLEPTGSDGRPDGEHFDEVIEVKGQADHVERVTVTPRGPVVSPLLEGVPFALSLQAVWLMPLPLDGFLSAQRATTFADFRRPFAHWPALPLNVLYADRSGATGYQLIGQVPRRRGSKGLIPHRPDAAAWEAELVPFDRMPWREGMDFLATANGHPPECGEWLGGDYIEEYRTDILLEELAARPVGVTVADCLALQKNVRSKPWQQLRTLFLATDAGTDGHLAEALALLRGWDGELTAGSPAATVFTLVMNDLAVAHARRVAPQSWQALLGGDGEPPLGRNLFMDRVTGPTVHRLLASEPRAEIAAALSATVAMLKANYGPSPEWWQWGDLRPLHLTHPVLGKHRLLKHIFNLPPVPVGGDTNTVSQAGVRPLAPLEPTHNFANLRMVFDPSNWGETRLDLAGGQSGNPLSPHYDDLFWLRERGDSVKFAWTPAEVLKAARETLRLTPAAVPSAGS
jgi:penicillin amidase